MTKDARNLYIWFLNKLTIQAQEKMSLILWNTCNYFVHNFQAFIYNQKEYKYTSKYYHNSKIIRDK